MQLYGYKMKRSNMKKEIIVQFKEELGIKCLGFKAPPKKKWVITANGSINIHEKISLLQ